MQEIQTIFPQAFYSKYLSNINGVEFTKREIDVIACLSSAKKTKKIASLLSIKSPKTVEAHIYNIRLKINCNSQEGIIDFIEASDKFSFIRKYYALLRKNALFEKSLEDIAKLDSVVTR